MVGWYPGFDPGVNRRNNYRSGAPEGEDPVDGGEPLRVPRLLPDPDLRHRHVQELRPVLLDARDHGVQQGNAHGYVFSNSELERIFLNV